MPKLFIPLSEHFPGRVTYRGMGHLEEIKKRFGEMGLLERVKESPFKQFFVAPEFQFSGVLVHQLLLRKISTKSDEEVHFLLGTKTCRFGLGEFALVTGLNFGAGPSQAELEEHLSCDRLVTDYFNDAEKVKLSQLQVAFNNCTVVEDVYKLGLCFFVEGVLNAMEDKLHIRSDILRIVEDLEFFFNYPWGKYSYKRLLGSCKKDMERQKALYEKKKGGEKVQKESKYTFYGFAPALQYWAFEAVQQLAQEFAVRGGYMVPRMLSWTVKKNREATRVSIAQIFSKSNVSTNLINN